jgi:hypothetical protein
LNASKKMKNPASIEYEAAWKQKHFSK